MSAPRESADAAVPAETYTIGEFARLSGVTPKALRHYDRVGALRPTVVDRSTRYRRYTIEQLATLYEVLALSRLGLTLRQVNDALGGRSHDTLADTLHAAKREIETRLVEDQARLAWVEKELAELSRRCPPSRNGIPPRDGDGHLRESHRHPGESGRHPCESPSQTCERHRDPLDSHRDPLDSHRHPRESGGPMLGVVLKEEAPVRVVAIRERIASYADADALLDRLARRVARDGDPAGTVSRARGAVWHDCGTRTGVIDCEAFVTAGPSRGARTGARSDERVLELPAAMLACAVHRGNEDVATATYAAAHRWIAAHGFSVAGPNREWYFGRAGGISLMEIQIPVRRARG